MFGVQVMCLQKARHNKTSAQGLSGESARDAQTALGLGVTLRLPLLALIIIGLGFLPGVMAPAKPFTPTVRVGQGQGNGQQSPFEEDHHRTDLAFKVFAAKPRSTPRLGGRPLLGGPELDAFLARLLKDHPLPAAGLCGPSEPPDDVASRLRRRQLPRRCAAPEDEPLV
ncbi:hypothetical protein DRW03_33735 [Corallococcus sp. H22C18031201]|nr:hypothetical protein DRW03_33735 [Corallococcus sp. H22C18031201]